MKNNVSCAKDTLRGNPEIELCSAQVKEIEKLETELWDARELWEVELEGGASDDTSTDRRITRSMELAAQDAEGAAGGSSEGDSSSGASESVGEELRKVEEVLKESTLVCKQLEARVDQLTKTRGSNRVDEVEINRRLPEIRLTKFDGDPLKFDAFWDSFCNIVHNKKGISPIDKFTYLGQSLVGEPLSLLLALEISADNYDLLVEQLKE